MRAPSLRPVSDTSRVCAGHGSSRISRRAITAAIRRTRDERPWQPVRTSAPVRMRTKDQPMADKPRRQPRDIPQSAARALGQAGVAADRLREPRRPRLGPEDGRRGRRCGVVEDARTQRRADVRRARSAQGRRDEARPGALGVRVDDSGRGGRAVPARAHQTAEPGPVAPGRQGAHRSRRATRPQLAQALPVLRRHSRGGRQHRSGAQGHLARRPRGRGQGAVPRRRSGPAGGSETARTLRAAVHPRRPRPGRARADQGGPRAHARGAGLPLRGRAPAALRRGARRRSRHPHPGRPRVGAQGHRLGVAGRPPAVTPDPGAGDGARRTRPNATGSPTSWCT